MRYTDILYSTGNIAIFYNNFKWSIIYKNIKSLCCPPETNIILYINYNLKKDLDQK